MRRHTLYVTTGLLALLLAFETTGLAQQAFVLPTARQGTVPDVKDPTVVRAINVVVDTTQLTARSRRLHLIIFDKGTLDLELDRVEPIPEKGLIWYGKVAKQPASSAILTLVGDTVSGKHRHAVRSGVSDPVRGRRRALVSGDRSQAVPQRGPTTAA